MHNPDFLIPYEIVGIFFLALLVRMIPHYFSSHGAGVDHWFWKSYIEKYRQTGKFPPDLPQFLLDEEQWYPPLFPLLIARCPEVIFDRFSHVIAAFIDLLRMVFAMAIIFYLTGRLTSVLGAGVVYAFTPILISYNFQLNPRGLAALFLDIVVVLLILLIWHAAPWWLWILVVLFSGLILLTHKMTTQLFWFLSLSVGVLTGEWRFLLLIPASMIMAFFLSKGFYFKVLLAHWDIVSFWNRNWPWISAHPVLESPVYGVPGYETPTKYFRSGLKGICRRLLYLTGFNPWAWAVLIVGLLMYEPNILLTNEDARMILWVALILFFAVLTTFVPVLRCLGNGYLYLYNSSFPAALAVGFIWGGLKHDAIINVILVLTFSLCLIGIGFYFSVLKKSKTLKVDISMNELLQRLRSLPDGVVICFPQHWHEVVAYKSKKAVMYGAHGYGFKRIEFIFPRVTEPIKTTIKRFNIKYLFTYENYLPDNFLKDLPPADIEKFGRYQLFQFKNG